MELKPSAQSSSQKENFINTINTSKRLVENIFWTFLPRSALFHMETRVCLKYFVRGCRFRLEQEFRQIICSHIRKESNQRKHSKWISLHAWLYRFILAYLLRKLLYHEVCDLKLHGDEWQKLHITNNTVKIPRSLPTKLESITVLDIHIFGDASILGYSVGTHAVLHHQSSVSQNLIANKSRLPKSEITNQRLKFVARHRSEH